MLVAVGLLGVLDAAGAAAITLEDSAADAVGWIAFIRALVVAVPVGVGIYAWYRRPANRFGPLLVLGGFVWGLTALAESGDPVLYSLGRLAGWFAEPLAVVTVLAFPLGRIEERAGRLVAAVAIGILLVLYLPTVPFVAQYPVPNPWADCGVDCPPNAFGLVDGDPGVIEAVIVPLRETLLVLMFLGVVGVLIRRIRRGSPLARRVQMPVLAVAVARVALVPTYLVARAADADPEVLRAVGWLNALLLPGLAIGFLIGMLRWRLFVASALEEMVTKLGSEREARLVRVLGQAMHDPTVDVRYWAAAGPSGWVTVDGDRADLPDGDDTRGITEIANAGRPVAAIIHDSALHQSPEFVEAVASIAMMELENQRLAAELRASVTELRRSRARIRASADAERRRIERNLHDGAQQRLVALSIKLRLAHEQLDADPATSRQLLDELETDADETLDEIRALAAGVYPALLAAGGLERALRSAARAGSLPVWVLASGLDRYSEDQESAIYFCCLEALQNAAKHAGPQATVLVSLAEADGRIRFEVSDDGVGFNPGRAGQGAGLTNMRDRIATVDGRLEVRSTPGEGTRVIGSAPAERRVQTPAQTASGPPVAASDADSRAPSHDGDRQVRSSPTS